MARTAKPRPCEKCGDTIVTRHYRNSKGNQSPAQWDMVLNEWHDGMLATKNEHGLNPCQFAAWANTSDISDTTPAPKPETPSDPLAALIASMIEPYLAGKVDEAAVQAIVDDRVRRGLETLAPRRVEIKVNDCAPVTISGQHYQTRDVIEAVMQGNVALVGPAGSGKTTVAETVAKALGLNFYSCSLSKMTPPSELRGFEKPDGKPSLALFAKAYAKGGLVLIDEADNGSPNALNVLNAALSNDCCAFPGVGMVQKHADFKCIIAMNTYGTGADALYVGRAALDAAFLDRFIYLRFGYDEGFERALATGLEAPAPTVRKLTPATPAKVAAWVDRVQALRKAAERNTSLKVVISPRASILGAKLLTRGYFTQNEVETMLIFKGMNETERRQLARA